VLGAAEKFNLTRHIKELSKAILQKSAAVILKKYWISIPRTPFTIGPELF
jgi:hypothetical protein